MSVAEGLVQDADSVSSSSRKVFSGPLLLALLFFFFFFFSGSSSLAMMLFAVGKTFLAFLGPGSSGEQRFRHCIHRPHTELYVWLARFVDL